MPKIFVSYRRADSKDVAGRIYDRLIQAFGEDHIFRDVHDIPPGVDFRYFIQEEIRRCEIVVVIIGPQWARIMRERQHQSNDFVRIEMESALEQRKITIPILVNGAVMPNAEVLPRRLQDVFPYLNAVSIGDDPNFHRDITRLIEQLQTPSLLPPPPLPANEPVPAPQPRTPLYKRLPWVVLVTGIVVPLLAAVISILPDLADRLGAPATPTSQTAISNPSPTNITTLTPENTAAAAVSTPVIVTTPVASVTDTPVFTVIPTETPTASATNTLTVTRTPTATSTPTNTLTPSVTMTPTIARIVIGAAAANSNIQHVSSPAELPYLGFLEVNGLGVWVYNEPRTASSIVGEVFSKTVPVIGRNEDESFYLIVSNDVVGWVQMNSRAVLTKAQDQVLPIVGYIAPTSTPRPTATLRPTSTPLPTSAAVIGWEIYRQDDFSSSPLPMGWSANPLAGLSFEEQSAIFKSQQNYSSGLFWDGFNAGTGFTEGEGVLIRFKYFGFASSDYTAHLNIHMEKGGWLSPETRIIGLQKEQGSNTWNLWYVYQNQIRNGVQPDFVLKQDSWYLLAMLIESDNTIRIRIWDVSTGFLQEILNKEIELPGDGWGSVTNAGAMNLSLKPNQNSTLVIDSVSHLRRVEP